MDSYVKHVLTENNSVEGYEISSFIQQTVFRPCVSNMNISPRVSSENLFSSEHLWSIERQRLIDDVNNQQVLQEEKKEEEPTDDELQCRFTLARITEQEPLLQEKLRQTTQAIDNILKSLGLTKNYIEKEHHARVLAHLYEK